MPDPTSMVAAHGAHVCRRSSEASRPDASRRWGSVSRLVVRIEHDVDDQMLHFPARAGQVVV